MNEEKLKFLGIDKWHELGYKGQGITIASREGLSKHGRKVLQVIEQIVPEANIIYKEDYRTTNVDIYTTSMFATYDKYEKNITKGYETFRRGVFLCCAVGNYDNEKQTFLSTLPYWTSVGACYLYANGTVKRTEYSSITKDLDYMSITNWKTASGIFTGTSCATPVFASMLTLVQCFFKAKCGRKLDNAELLNFINDNTHDLEAVGQDDKTGRGIFILPSPEEINVKEYIKMDKIIELEIGSKKAKIDNKEIELDTEPILKDNRTLVPIRFIAEALGCEVFWDNGKIIIQT